MTPKVSRERLSDGTFVERWEEDNFGLRLILDDSYGHHQLTTKNVRELIYSLGKLFPDEMKEYLQDWTLVEMCLKLRTESSNGG